MVPSTESIIECERRICMHFKWNLNFVLPINFVRMILTQGVIYTSELKPYEKNLPDEDYKVLREELARAISAEALSLCDILMTKGSCSLREKYPSEIAASIIYFARKNILQADDISKLVRVPCIWPEEIITLSRCSENQINLITQNPDEQNKIVVPNSTPVSQSALSI